MFTMSGQRLGLTTYYRTISVDNKPTTVIIGPNGEPLKLPESLESLPKSDHFPSQRHRWNTNEEIASMLIAFDRHGEWLSKEVKIRPKSGSMLLYSRKKVRYRRDGYCWKKRKDGKTTREDHMKLKVQGMECIYGCYVHSAILPTFHRRCYWLLQNPDIVLVHYLNVPYPDDNKLVIASSVTLFGDKKEWTKEELISQLKPMFFSEEEPDLNNELEVSTAETVESIVTQLMEKQRCARAAALSGKSLDCPGCNDPNQECNLHHVPGTTVQPSTPSSGRGRVQKSEAHTTTSGRANNARSHKRMLQQQQQHHQQQQQQQQHRGHDNNNQFYKANERYNPQGSYCSSSSQQVTSTTGDHHLHPQQQHRLMDHARHHQGQIGNHHHAPLVLSLSQIQSGGGLLIVNPHGNDHHQMNGGLASMPPGSTPNDVNGHLLHSSSSARSDTSSNSPLDSTGLVASPVSSAVRSLANLSDFSLDVSNGNYDNYGGITDSLLSAEAAKDPKAEVAQQQDHRPPTSGGPLLDFKSAFSDLDSKPSDLSFLQDSLDLSHDEIHRTLQQSRSGSGHHASGGPAHAVDLNPMEFIEHNAHNGGNGNPAANGHHNPFELDFDKFDMLSEFPDLDHYNAAVASAASNSTTAAGMIHHGAAGPLLSSTMHSATPPKNPRHHITDYSPEWAWPDGGSKVLVIGPWSYTHCPGDEYHVLFDGEPVGANLVQQGVLATHCPAHSAGMVKLQVALNGNVISNAVIFEYRLKDALENTNEEEELPDLLNVVEEEDLLRNNNTHSLYLCNDHSCQRILRTIILQKLDDLMAFVEEACLEAKRSALTILRSSSVFEDYLITLVKYLSQKKWKMNDGAPSNPGQDSCPNLLYLASALGLNGFANLLFQWADANPHPELTKEVDCSAQDPSGYTPLMRACANGNRDLALKLYNRDPTVMKKRNLKNESCLDIAKAGGHHEIVTVFDCLESKINTFLTITPSKGDQEQPEFARPFDISCCKKSRTKSLDEHRQSPSNRCRMKLRSTSPFCSSSPGASSPLQQQPLTISIENKQQQPFLMTRKQLFKRASFDLSLSKNKDFKSARMKEKPLRSASKDDIIDRNPGSPFIDVEALSDEDERGAASKMLDDQVEDQKVLTLAEQFLAAMPERIKHVEDMGMQWEECSCDASQSDDLGIESMGDDLDLEAYRDAYTPASSLSPVSSCLHSPRSMTSPSPRPYSEASGLQNSPPCTTADLQEFLLASIKCERDMSNLTLSDQEQRELYEAAQIIQKAYRSYKGRKKVAASGEGLDREAKAAVLIQNYYRRYKQYLYWKQMCKAATLIQNKYRRYCEHKRFKKSQEAATCIQNYYRTYRENQTTATTPSRSRESTPSSGGLKRTYSQRRQNQAAKKIQQFMRKTHLRPIKEIVVTWRGAPDRAGGCFGCRKREAGPDSTSAGVPAAKLPQFQNGGHAHQHLSSMQQHHHQQHQSALPHVGAFSNNGYANAGANFYGGWNLHGQQPPSSQGPHIPMQSLASVANK